MNNLNSFTLGSSEHVDKSNKNNLDTPDAQMLASDTSVFGGRKMFADTVSAYRAGLEEIYRLGGLNELGFELIPGPGGTIKLGKLVEGTVRNVNVANSDYNSDQDRWRIFGGSGRTSYPAGHSHPDQFPHDGRALSIADFNYMIKSRPLGGFHSIGVIDIHTGQGFIVKFAAGTDIPAQVKWCLKGNRGFPITKTDTDITTKWFKQMVESGKLQIILSNELGNVGLPPAFKFDYKGADKADLNYFVPAQYIRRATQ